MASDPGNGIAHLCYFLIKELFYSKVNTERMYFCLCSSTLYFLPDSASFFFFFPFSAPCLQISTFLVMFGLDLLMLGRELYSRTHTEDMRELENRQQELIQKKIEHDGA